MPLTLGAYTACLHDRPLEEALDVLQAAGLTSVEVNTGGFLPSPHCPVDLLLSSERARRDYLDVFASRGMELTGLNCNGNPLNPLPGVGPEHADDLRRTIELAGLLGVRHVVTMSGTPGSDPGARYPSWVVNPWDGVHMDVLDHQWDVAAGFWSHTDARARDAGARVAIEMHPHNLVFSPVTLERLVGLTGATNVGAEMDPSHLMWQGMDVVAGIRRLGPLVFHAAAEDAMITPGVDVRGVLDTSFTRVPAEAPDKFSRLDGLPLAADNLRAAAAAL
jgi:sugar phosphate isomerase/epimerase